MKKEQMALLKTIQQVILYLRVLGWDGKNSKDPNEQFEMIADLADSIHNIPEALMQDEIDLNFHVEIMLGGFDSKEYSDAPCSPYQIYQNELRMLKNEM
ncbi:MAG: hypothetical protein F6K10_22610 [Moorea sp. SIO2B7]|nr:hypothetical protein [Moorena sp. SIO2B7]